MAEVLKSLLESTERQAFSSINLALSIIVALSWLEAIKFYIDRLVKSPKQKGMWMLINAVLITLVAVVVMAILSRITQQNIENTLALPLVTQEVRDPQDHYSLN
tara:strand:+ start:229 stop:540 length:312 start_codon:yes stop_codon:yes gene_type:complete